MDRENSEGMLMGARLDPMNYFYREISGNHRTPTQAVRTAVPTSLQLAHFAIVVQMHTSLQTEKCL